MPRKISLSIYEIQNGTLFFKRIAQQNSKCFVFYVPTALLVMFEHFTSVPKQKYSMKNVRDRVYIKKFVNQQ